MKEREANRKYRLELFSAMLAYMVVLFGSIFFAKGMDAGLGAHAAARHADRSADAGGVGDRAPLPPHG